MNWSLLRLLWRKVVLLHYGVAYPHTCCTCVYLPAYTYLATYLPTKLSFWVLLFFLGRRTREKWRDSEPRDSET